MFGKQKNAPPRDGYAFLTVEASGVITGTRPQNGTLSLTLQAEASTTYFWSPKGVTPVTQKDNTFEITEVGCVPTDASISSLREAEKLGTKVDLSAVLINSNEGLRVTTMSVSDGSETIFEI